MEIESMDDILLMNEELLGRQLSMIDDFAIEEQNKRLKRAREFIPD